jgi:hypothetical protein
MFDELRNAWKLAVANFHRELRAGATSPDSERLLAMRRDLAAAVAALGRIETHCRRAREELAREREQEEVCRRREEMAARIADRETARVAAEFRERHCARARVLERVVDALGGECELRRGDVEEMRRRLDEFESTADAAATRASGFAGGAARDVLETDRDEAVFRRLEHAARERAAAARLEELKRNVR